MRQLYIIAVVRMRQRRQNGEIDVCADRPKRSDGMKKAAADGQRLESICFETEMRSGFLVELAAQIDEVERHDLVKIVQVEVVLILCPLETIDQRALMDV